MSVPKEVSNYMKQIGSNGGKKSRRVLTKEQSAAMRAKRKPKRFEGPSVCGENTRSAYIAATEEKL